MGLGSSKTGKLTDDELDHVKSTWKVVMENPEENDVPIHDLHSNKAFRKHATSIIQAINNVTLHIDNDTLLRNDLNALGKLHRMKNITEQQFEELKAVMLEILESEFKLSKEILSAWNKTLDIAFVYIFEGLRESD